MMEKSKERLIHYIVSALIALMIVVLIFVYELHNYGDTTLHRIRFLCDGFFVSAVLFLGFGLMMCISQAGGFYAFSYLLYSVRYIFTPVKARFSKRKSYIDYRMEKSSRSLEDKDRLKWRLLLVGLVCLLLSLVLLAVFENRV